MLQDWRDPLREALKAVDMDLETLSSLDKDGPVSIWLASALENENMFPTPSIYLAISDLTGIEPEILTGEVSPADTLHFAMRSRGQSAPQQILRRSLEVLRAARAVLRLEPYCRLRKALDDFWSQFSQKTTGNLARKAGREAALVLRGKAKLGTDPILDLAELVEGFGVPVEYSLDLPNGLHGVTSWTHTRQGWLAMITINARDRWTVQRYSLAHEFCHVLHMDRPSDLTTEFGESTSIANDPTEARAEAFAGSLLAPAAGLAAHWQTNRLSDQPLLISLARVMWNWGISREAACYALEGCQSIPWSTVQTKQGLAAHVGDMIHRAGLDTQWAQMEKTENIFTPSVWLTEATAQLFVDGRLPVENYAMATHQDPSDAIRRITEAS